MILKLAWNYVPNTFTSSFFKYYERTYLKMPFKNESKVKSLFVPWCPFGSTQGMLSGYK